MSDSLYHDLILDHYRHPRKYGSLKKPTNSHDASNPLCGDMLHIEVEVKDGIITDVAYTGQGCAISQAAASILYESVAGMEVTQARGLTKEYLLEKLGISLSPNRLKCALLSLEALKASL